MNVLAVISPGLKVLFERVGKPEVINRPDLFRFGGTGRSSPAITLDIKSYRPTRPSRSSATRSIDNSLGGFFLHW